MAFLENDFSTCQCNSGFLGDGFECEFFRDFDYGECQRNSECSSNENCIMKYEDDQFTFKCTQKDIIDGQVQTTTEEPKQERKPDLCRTDLECADNAKCDYNPFELRYKCQCVEYYVGDGINECEPGPDAGCDITDDCDENAECLLVNDRHQCHCREHYEGDGKTCVKMIIGCNVLDNCDKYAMCLFNPIEKGFRCQCDVARVKTSSNTKLKKRGNNSGYHLLFRDLMATDLVASRSWDVTLIHLCAIQMLIV